MALIGAGCAQFHGEDPAADRAAIRAVSAAWKQAFNQADVQAVSELYAEDAVLAAPGLPPVQGKRAITAYFMRTVAQFAGAGVIVSDAPLGEVSVSGDLGFFWETYSIVSRSGAAVDSGKLLTLYRRTQGRWLIVADTWSSSRPATPTVR